MPMIFFSDSTTILCCKLSIHEKKKKKCFFRNHGVVFDCCEISDRFHCVSVCYRFVQGCKPGCQSKITCLRVIAWVQPWSQGQLGRAYYEELRSPSMQSLRNAKADASSVTVISRLSRYRLEVRLFNPISIRIDLFADTDAVRIPGYSL